MNRKILSGIAIFAITTMAAWNASLNSQSNKLSDIALANVEALANEYPEATCTFSKVSKNQEKNTLKCSDSGTLCCVMN
jgi:hypothetical protein